MPRKQSSPRKLNAAQRKAKALRLRKRGLGYAEIARILGCGESLACKIVNAELKRLSRQADGLAEDVRRLELERLDMLLATLAPQIFGKGVDPRQQLFAVDRWLKAMGRRAKLLGLDDPRQADPADDATGLDPQLAAKLLSAFLRESSAIAGSGLRDDRESAVGPPGPIGVRGDPPTP